MSVRVLIAWATVAAAAVVGGAAPTGAAAGIATQTCAAMPAGNVVGVDALASFEATAPVRLVDTRDGTGGLAAPIGAGCTMRLDIGGTTVPGDAEAVALSVTALAAQRGFLTVFPCASGQPETSNVNTRDQRIPTPNLVVAIPDPGRLVCIYSLFEADVVIDLTGWWTEDGDQRMTTIAPVRVDDSRNDPGRTPMPANTTRTIPLSSFIPANATAVIGNLTVTEPQADGFMTAFPCDRPFPLASNLNFRAGESRAVAIMVGLDAAARLCVQASTDAHVVLDVSGFYAPAPQFGPAPGMEPLAGTRVADSRTGQGGWNDKFAAGSTRTLRPVAGLANRSQATGVVLNVVVTEAEADGFVTFFPCDEDLPNASTVNYTPAGESTNMVVVDLSSSGTICVYALTRAHVVVDLFGVVRADSNVLVETMTVDGFTWPPYDPSITDYIVECTGSTTDVGLTLLRNTSARVNGVPVSSGTVDLPTQIDERFRVQLQRGSTTQNLSFRCVRDDFPRLNIERSAPTTPGWYVTSIREPGAGSGYVVILDRNGVPVWYKRVAGDLIDVQRRSDGRLVMVQSLGPRYGVDPDRGYLAMSLFGTVTEQLLAVPDPSLPGIPMPTDHHEYLSLPGGARAVLVYPVVNENLSSVGGAVNDQIADGVIQEIASNDALVWSWRTRDHFGLDVSYPVRWGPLQGYNGNEVDIYHLNSLQRVGDGSGDYVASARHMDNVFRVDRATGAVDWVLGEVPPDSPAATLAAQLMIVGDPLGGPRRPHDARQNGNVLTLYDNRTDTGQAARAVAYQLDVAAGTATMLWEIRDGQGRSSPGLGSTRVTADNSIVVSWGGGIQPVFGEYSLAGAPLLEITQVAGGNAYRFLKEPASAFNLDVLRATAGGSVEIP